MSCAACPTDVCNLCGTRDCWCRQSPIRISWDRFHSCWRGGRDRFHKSRYAPHNMAGRDAVVPRTRSKHATEGGAATRVGIDIWPTRASGYKERTRTWPAGWKAWRRGERATAQHTAGNGESRRGQMAHLPPPVFPFFGRSNRPFWKLSPSCLPRALRAVSRQMLDEKKANFPTESRQIFRSSSTLLDLRPPAPRGARTTLALPSARRWRQRSRRDNPSSRLRRG